MRTWANVATLAKTKSLQGGFVVKSATGLPFVLSEGMEIAFVPPRLEEPRGGVVTSVTPIDNTSAVVYFDSIDDITVARNLVGSYCLAKREDFDASTPSSVFEEDEQWTVKLIDGTNLGTLIEVIESTMQPVLSIKRIEQDKEEPLLIPYVDEFVVDIDDSTNVITVDVPQGLLELNCS